MMKVLVSIQIASSDSSAFDRDVIKLLKLNNSPETLIMTSVDVGVHISAVTVVTSTDRDVTLSLRDVWLSIIHAREYEISCVTC